MNAASTDTSTHHQHIIRRENSTMTMRIRKGKSATCRRSWPRGLLDGLTPAAAVAGCGGAAGGSKCEGSRRDMVNGVNC